MATNVRGRTSRHPRTFGQSAHYSAPTSQTGWGRTSTATGNRPARQMKHGSTDTNVPPAYKGWNNDFWNKIYSFRMLYNQTRGSARYTRPSVATLNSFSNWINKGAIIQTVSTAQVARWSRSTKHNFNTRTPTPTACKNILWDKFGKNNIKAVARTKTGGFMVATVPAVKGKPFWFPK